MNKTLVWLIGRAIALVGTLSLVLSGCTTSVYQVAKDASFTEKLQDSSIVLFVKPDLRTTITVTGSGYQPTVSEGNRAESREQIGKLVRLVLTQARDVVGSALAANVPGISPSASSTVRSKPYLRIDIVGATSDCGTLVCRHAIAIEAYVVDPTKNKRVWQGNFKSGPPIGGGAVDDMVLKSFTDSLMGELKKSGVI